EEGVVVAGGAEGGGFFIELHGFVEVVVGHGAGEGGVVVEEFLGVAFGDEAGVVGAVVVAFEAGEDVFGFDFFHLVAVAELVGDAFLQGDDRVVGDVDVLGADFGAALGDVAQADALGFFEVGLSVLGVEWVHL